MSGGINEIITDGPPTCDVCNQPITVWVMICSWAWTGSPVKSMDICSLRCVDTWLRTFTSEHQVAQHERMARAHEHRVRAQR